ncbi:MAG: iron-containing alcohol dehydrogenase [Synergistaceae bacterium]|jgi:3-deoxy-alpha-D-manno-octulosonate 8-oxidase|nr:iron-containing alcohol dehydrogenase [Synergistaceae bacterium]
MTDMISALNEQDVQKTPETTAGFATLGRWWATDVSTDVVPSADGAGDILRLLSAKSERPFFIIDDALVSQPAFANILALEDKYLFAASASEPRTGDVDALVALLRDREKLPDAIVGVGGGSAMDLAKATGLCLVNPKSVAGYQGYGLDMKRGPDVWVLPTLAGAGAEVTPIAVLRGPERKLGINNNFAAPSIAVVDPGLTRGARKFNRFYSMMDCFFHHYEITKSVTSAPLAKSDALRGLALARLVLSSDLAEFDETNAVRSSMASILGGSASIGGRVGAAHAISYGLSNASPVLPHSVAVTISMFACAELYDDSCGEAADFLEINGMARPRAGEYGINSSHVGLMTRTAIGMEKLWQSRFGDKWPDSVNEKFIEGIYRKILE